MRADRRLLRCNSTLRFGLIGAGLLLVATGYLITRPHVGPVWHVVWIPSRTSRHPRPPLTRYVNEDDCVAAKLRFEQTADVNGAYCASEKKLLWGW